MPSYRIAHYPEKVEDLQQKFRNWNEAFDESRLGWQIRDNDHARRVFRENTWLPRLTWAKTSNFATWGGGVEFGLFAHKVRLSELPLADGTFTEVVHPERFSCHVYAKNSSEGLLVFLSGRATSLEAARVRLSRQLKPLARRGGLGFIALTSPMLKELVDGDTTGTDDIHYVGYKKADGANNIAIWGGRAAKSSVNRYINREGIYKVSFRSVKLGTDITINGDTGTFSSREATPTALHKYVQSTVIPIIKKHNDGRITGDGQGSDED